MALALASMREAADVEAKRSATRASDIISDVMWSVELEPEVEAWIGNLPVADFAMVVARVERLAERGNQLRMPASRSLGEGLFELRFDLHRTSQRITYYFGSGRRIVLLTVFRKQRQNERHEVKRARQAMTRCIDEGHTADDEEKP